MNSENVFLCSNVLWFFPPLDGFDVEILLLARGEVWPHDANLQSGGHAAREHATKSVEAPLVAGWDHLGNVHHQRSLGVAVLNT